MEQELIEEKTFEKISFLKEVLKKGDYEYCKFINCDFSDADISNIKFLECEFIGCNMSLAKINGTVFRDVKFKDCKMLGLRFDTCNEFGLAASFDTCNLNHSSFYRSKIKKTVFKNSQLQEVDFTDSDLSHSVFDQCDLMNTRFENTNLEKADFRTAINYSFNPEMNKIKKAKFSLSGVQGLLERYDITIEP
jgi:fluoroquinolone resistance protein